MAVLMASINELDRAWMLVRQLLPTGRRDDEPLLVADFGYPQNSSINRLFDVAIEMRDMTNAANCLELLMLHTPTMQPKSYIDRIIERCEMNDLQKRILISYERFRQ